VTLHSPPEGRVEAIIDRVMVTICLGFVVIAAVLLVWALAGLTYHYPWQTVAAAIVVGVLWQIAGGIMRRVDW
jgi:hypothetical protein